MCKILFSLMFIVFSQVCFAIDNTDEYRASPPIIPPQAASCLQTTMTNAGSSSWKTINLNIKNLCATAVNFQNTTITFENTSNLNTRVC